MASMIIACAMGVDHLLIGSAGCESSPHPHQAEVAEGCIPYMAVIDGFVLDSLDEWNGPLSHAKSYVEVFRQAVGMFVHSTLDALVWMW